MSEFSIGRLPQNDIVLPDQSVSREHAVLTIEGEVFSVRDLNSSNGTFVNGMRIYGETIIKRNDILKVGSVLVPWMNYITMNKSEEMNNSHFQNPQKEEFAFGSKNVHKVKLPNSGSALIHGIIGLVFALGIIGVVWSAMAFTAATTALKQYDLNPEMYTEGSHQQAKTAKVLGIIGLSLVGLIFCLIIIGSL